MKVNRLLYLLTGLVIGTFSHFATDVHAETVNGLTNVAQISSGEAHTLALREDGTVWAWGNNSHGQLGDGSTVSQTAPVQVPGLTDMIQVAAGRVHSLALKDDGTVWAWGSWIGDYESPDPGRYIATPVQVSGISDVKKLGKMWYHCIAIKEDDSLWVWQEESPQQMLTGVTDAAEGGAFEPNSSIFSHIIALKSDGTVWGWGTNIHGELGIDTRTYTEFSFVQVHVLSDIQAIATGSYHSLALKNDGSVWAWGSSTYGQLGNSLFGSDEDCSPIFDHAEVSTRCIPIQVGYLSDVQSIDASGFSSVAVTGEGVRWKWGDGSAVPQIDGPAPGSDTTMPSWDEGEVITVSDLSEWGAILSWPFAKDNRSTTEYRVYRNGLLIRTVPGAQNILPLWDLSPGTTYTFRIEAGDSSGNWNSTGITATVQTPGDPADETPPSWPAGSMLELCSVCHTTVKVKWTPAIDDVGVTQYRIYDQNDRLMAEFPTPEPLTYFIRYLEPGQTYTFRIEAGDEAGNWSTGGPTVTVTTTQPE